MAAIRIYRRLQDLQDVDPNGLPQSGVPVYHTDVSSFVVETVAAGGGGSFSLGASNLGNTLGDTGVTGTRVVLAGAGAITLSQATDANGGTITLTSPATSVLSAVAPLSTSTNGNTISILGPAQFSGGMGTDGNTAGDTGFVTGRLDLAGGNNITLSGSTNAGSQTITIIGAAGGGGTQTAISGLANSETTYTSGTVNLSALGNLTIRSTTGQAFQFSVAPQSVQPETQTFIGGISASNTLYTSGTVNITGSGIVTVQSGTGQRIIINASQSVQPETKTFIGGIAASNTTYTSGTITISGVGGGVTVNSNTGQRVDISVAAPVAQTGTQFSAGLTNSGNTSGDTGTVAGRLLLVGTNNITLSGSTNGASMTITMSGPSVAGAQTGISGIANSETTFTSGTVKMSELGAITIRSTTGQQLQFSVPNTSVISAVAPLSTTTNGSTISILGPAQFSAGISGGNTSGDTGTVTGQVVVAGGNNITVSGSTNAGSMTITISGGAAGGFSAGVSNIGNTSGNTGITGSRLVLSGAQSITLSQSTNASGATIAISGASTSQSVQSLGMYAAQNTTGQSSSTTMDARTLSVAGDGIVSVGYSAGSLRISASQSVQPETQTFIGGVGNTQTTYTSGTVGLLELGAITVRSTTGNQFQLSVNSQSVQTQGQMSAGVSTGGNTAGDTGVTGTRLVFVGSNNITLSQATAAAGGTITISGPTTAAQTVQTQGILNVALSNVGNTSGDTGINSGTRYVLAGGNNITLSGSSAANATTVTISAANQSVQTQDVLSIGVSTGGNTAGNTTVNTGSRMVFVGTNMVSLSEGTAAGATTVTLDATNQNLSIGVSTGGNTSGNTTVNTGSRLVFVGSNNITLSQGTGAGATTLTISGPTTAAQTGTQFSAGLSNIGNTSGDTVTVNGRLILAGGNNVTLSGSSNGISETITISAFNQTVESQSIGMSNLGNTAGTTGIASGGQVRFIIVGSNNITASQSLNGASGTLSLSGNPSFSAGVSTGGNTGGATGITGTRMVWVGSNNITLSQTTDASGGTVSIFGPSPGAAQYSIGASNLGNTAGSTGVTGTRIVFVGSNAISLSQSTDATGATITFNDTVSAFLAGVSTMGNTAGDTGVTGTRMVLVGSSPLSLSQATGANGNTVTFNAPATSSLSGASGISISTNGSTISVFPAPYTSTNPFQQAMAVTGQQGNATLHIAPYQFPHLQYDRMLLSYQFSNATNSSNSFTISNWVGIYTKNASTLSLVSSISTSTNFSGSGTVGSYSLYGGMRQLSIPWTMTLSQGDYWIGIVTRSTTGGGAGHTLNQMLKSHFTAATLTGWSGLMGAATNATVQQQLGLGTYSVSTAGIPNTVGFSEITGTGSLPLFVPMFQFRSGTV